MLAHSEKQLRIALSLLLLAALTACSAKPSGPLLWQQGAVKALLTEVKAMDSNYAEYRLEVTDGKARYCWSSSAMGSPRERRAELGKVVYKEGHLFVPASCGGGNASKCVGYQAFALEPELKYLGNVTGRWDGQAVLVYDNGVIYDTGDQLEINELLSHAESPRYTVAYTSTAGKLAFDAERTWGLNATPYADAQDDPPGFLHRAGLAKLCGKTKELAAVTAKAKRAFDKGRFKAFEASLKQMPFGKCAPSAFIPLIACAP